MAAFWLCFTYSVKAMLTSTRAESKAWDSHDPQEPAARTSTLENKLWWRYSMQKACKREHLLQNKVLLLESHECITFTDSLFSPGVKALGSFTMRVYSQVRWRLWGSCEVFPTLSSDNLMSPQTQWALARGNGSCLLSKASPSFEAPLKLTWHLRIYRLLHAHLKPSWRPRCVSVVKKTETNKTVTISSARME